MPSMPHADSPGLIQGLTGLAPFVAALAALFVGLLQWRIQSRHLKHNLYEKRYAIYDAARTYLVEMMQKDGKTEISEYQRFRAATDPAEFLFPMTVFEHMQKIGKLGLDYRTAQQKFELYQRYVTPQLIPPDRDDPRFQEAVEQYPVVAEEVNTHVRYVIAELEGRLKTVFVPHLKLEGDRPWFERFEAGLDSWMRGADERLAERYKR
jgi:hypothetical protein